MYSPITKKDVVKEITTDLQHKFNQLVEEAQIFADSWGRRTKRQVVRGDIYPEFPSFNVSSFYIQYRELVKQLGCPSLQNEQYAHTLFHDSLGSKEGGYLCDVEVFVSKFNGMLNQQGLRIRFNYVPIANPNEEQEIVNLNAWSHDELKQRVNALSNNKLQLQLNHFLSLIAETTDLELSCKIRIGLAINHLLLDKLENKTLDKNFLIDYQKVGNAFKTEISPLLQRIGVVMFAISMTALAIADPAFIPVAIGAAAAGLGFFMAGRERATPASRAFDSIRAEAELVVQGPR